MITFTDLQQQVVNFYSEFGIEVSEYVLDDPWECINALGFNGFSEYCAAMNEKYPHNQDAITYFIGGAK